MSECKKCGKALRSDNRGGYCQKHSYLSVSRKLARKKYESTPGRNKRINELKRLWYQKNKEKELGRTKAFYQKNKEKINKQRKPYFIEYGVKNKEKIKMKKKVYYLKNKEKFIERNKEYAIKNRKQLSEKARIWAAKRRKEDPIYKIIINLRKRTRHEALKKYKQDVGNEYTGCSPRELKIYLSSKFQPGMTWENYGYRGWHIDHIKPLSSFDFRKIEDRRKACHYTNLQPLWAKDNFKKSNKIL